MSTSELRQHFFLTFFDRLVESLERGDPSVLDGFVTELVTWGVRRDLGLAQMLSLPLQMFVALREHTADLDPGEQALMLAEAGEVLNRVGLCMAAAYDRVTGATATLQREQAEEVARQLEDRLRWQEEIVEWVQTLRSFFQPMPTELTDALTRLTEAVERMPNVVRVAIWLPDETTQTLRVRVARGTDTASLLGLSILTASTSPLAQSFRGGGQKVVPSYEPTAEPQTAQKSLPPGKGMVVAVLPLAEGLGRGVMSVEVATETPNARLPDGQLDLLDLVVRIAAAAFELASASRKAEDLQAEMERQAGERTAILEQANRQLEHLARARSDFIHIAAHELKTPLTLLRGYTDILREEVDRRSASELRSVMEGMDRGIERLNRIVGDMIDISRIETELLQLHFEEFSLTSLVRLILEETAAWVQERRHSVSVEGIADLPPVRGDARRLHQAILNIVANSIKFTPDGGRISIRGRVLEAQGAAGTDYIEIVVADTGIGVAKEEQERIFEKFYRAGDVSQHSSGDYKFKGAGPGLGLPIARGIIEAHGGRVWVESEGYDEARCPGSEFHLVLPVRPETLHNDRRG
ncbi:MAG: sensor histidine kinase [Anaerolineae bacterium]